MPSIIYPLRYFLWCIQSHFAHTYGTKTKWEIMFITLSWASIVDITKVECSVLNQMRAWIWRTYWGHSKTAITTMEAIHKNYPYNQSIQRIANKHWLPLISTLA